MPEQTSLTLSKIASLPNNTLVELAKAAVQQRKDGHPFKTNAVNAWTKLLVKEMSLPWAVAGAQITTAIMMEVISRFTRVAKVQPTRSKEAEQAYQYLQGSLLKSDGRMVVWPRNVVDRKNRPQQPAL